jgi:hypothetical protein
MQLTVFGSVLDPIVEPVTHDRYRRSAWQKATEKAKREEDDRQQKPAKNNKVFLNSRILLHTPNHVQM